MPSKAGKKNGQAAVDPVLTAVIEEVVDTPAAAAVIPSPSEGDQSTAVPETWIPPAGPPLPTALDPIAAPFPEEHSPDQAIGTLNHLVAQGVLGKEEFDAIYLHHLGPLGATQQNADEHWTELQQKLEAERVAAAQLAAEMVEQTKPLAIAPWDPAADPTVTNTKVTEMRRLFNRMVAAIRKHRAESGSPHQLAGYLKDRIASDLSTRAHISYTDANELIASWAGTSSDTQLRSIALQVAAAEKFGLQPTGFIAHRDQHFQATDPNYAKTKATAAKLVDAMHEASQQWLAEQGIKEVVVWRGMKQSVGTSQEVLHAIDAADKPLEVAAHLNPMNSWSLNPKTALAFAGTSGYLLSARVPASHVIGCCFTGAGCLREHEFVVLGGTEVKVSAVSKAKVQWQMPSTGWAA